MLIKDDLQSQPTVFLVQRTLKRELSKVSLDVLQMKHSYVHLSADIHMRKMFKSTPSVRLALYIGNKNSIGDSLDSLNMLRMRGDLHLFGHIWLYI